MIDIVGSVKAAVSSGLQSLRTFGSSHVLLTGERNYLQFQVINPSKLAEAFTQADQGNIDTQAVFFAMIEQADPHIFAELGKRRRGVASLEWRIDPPKDASQAEIDRCGELADMIRSIDGFRQSLYDITDAVGKGFSALELDWQTGDVWLPKQLLWTPQSQFMVDNKTGELMLKPKMGSDGVALEPARWLLHEHKSMSGYIETAPLFRVLAWCYAYKAYNARDMQRFLEVYGLPLRLGKFPEGSSDKTRRDLLKAVSNIGSDAAATVPMTAQIEFIQANQGKVKDFLDAIRYWDQKISVAVLGSTLTSQVDSGSNTEALGKIHEEMRLELIDADAAQIAPTIAQQLVQRIALVNGMFKPDRLPWFGFEIVEPVDAESVIKVLQTGVGMGMRVPLDWAHRKLQIPQAGKNDAVLQMAAATVPPAADKEQALRAMLGAEQGERDPMVKRLLREAGDTEGDYTNKLFTLVSDAGSLDAAADAVLDAIAKQELQAPLAAKVGEAAVAAHLSGRAREL